MSSELIYLWVCFSLYLHSSTPLRYLTSKKEDQPAGAIELPQAANPSLKDFFCIRDHKIFNDMRLVEGAEQIIVFTSFDNYPVFTRNNKKVCVKAKGQIKVEAVSYSFYTNQQKCIVGHKDEDLNSKYVPSYLGFLSTRSSCLKI